MGGQIKRKDKILAKILLLFSMLIIFTAAAKTFAAKQETDLTELSIEDLMNVEIKSTATLTDTKPRLVPAAVTTITDEQIRASGARSLFELLDIYVPNFEWLRNHWEPDVMGVRGIINDRDDKYLLLVNGRNMNQRTHSGALSEQDMVLLQDIHHIDVIRGPGSALYGPGAVAMVINIVTYNAGNFKGTEVTGRLGAIEEFYTGEVKHSQPFDDNDGGLFVYGGMGEYVGASKYDAPQYYPYSFPGGTGYPGEGTQAGDRMTNAPIGRDGASPDGHQPVKTYIQITRDNWDIWARYTRGGKDFAPATAVLAPYPAGWGNRISALSFYEYQQATGWIGYKQELTKDIDIDYAFSYYLFDNVNVRKGEVANAFREDNYYGKTLLKWQPVEQHKVAFGAEISHMELGKNNAGWPHEDATSQEFAPDTKTSTGPMPRWSTNMYSFLGEWQWTINEKWTTFLGGRIDDHTYTDPMYSPRAAVIYTPTDKDALKLMWSRSVRANFEAEMKRQSMMDANFSNNSSPEKLDSVELRYERQHNKNLDLAASVFFYQLKAISWNQSTMQSAPVGTQKQYGVELEASYHNEKTRVTISHAYTKLLDFTLEPGQTSYITAKPYGFGNDLTNWSNNITKLTADHKLDEKWSVNSSLRIYWGFPGMKDYDKYYPYSGMSASFPNYPIIENGWERAYRGSYYWDLGLQYKPNKDLIIGITGYNLLGIFNRDFNKRNYIEVVGNGDFRDHAPAVGVSVTYKF
ncbi:MAG: TonB-dependent receptor [Sedimentisphaerales bacterium]